jgi:hypothetical protein
MFIYKLLLIVTLWTFKLHYSVNIVYGPEILAAVYMPGRASPGTWLAQFREDPAFVIIFFILRFS